MFRQTRSDVSAPGYRLWTGLAAVGAAVLWVSLKHLSSPPVAAAGGLLAVAGTGQMYRTKSRSLIEVCGREFVEPLYHEVEASVSPDDIRSDARSFAERAADHAEVESLTVRPSPMGGADGQFVELQLNGGRMSGSLATAIEESAGVPKMREPSSDDAYTVFVLFGE